MNDENILIAEIVALKTLLEQKDSEIKIYKEILKEIGAEITEARSNRPIPENPISLVVVEDVVKIEVKYNKKFGYRDAAARVRIIEEAMERMKGEAI